MKRLIGVLAVVAMGAGVMLHFNRPNAAEPIAVEYDATDAGDRGTAFAAWPGP